MSISQPLILSKIKLSLTEDEGARRLGLFVRTASGDRQVFLLRMMNGALAYHLFCASPQADEAVRRHLRGRTFYLDTTVLYSLVARDVEGTSLREELLAATTDLGCKLRVTRQTLVEFQDSVRHYRGLLERNGITDRAMARALLSERAVDELDDFRGGFYRALLRDPSLTTEVYSLPYETIEEQLSQWGIPRAEVVPTEPTQDQSGKWVILEGVADYEKSLTEYLTLRPRRGHEQEPPDPAAVKHDAIMLAWVQRQRQFRAISVPTRPSQVETWFLTSDRKLTKWDRDYVKTHGLGAVPRCLTLDDWLEGIAVLFPPIRENQVVGAVALRELSLTCPPIAPGDGLTAADLEQVGRVAQVFQLHPDEAARVAADQRFARDLTAAKGIRGRFEAIKSGVLRIKDAEIEQLRAVEAVHRSAIERAHGVARRQQLERERIEAERTSLAQAKTALEPDATFGRKQRVRGPLSIGVAVALSFVTFAAILVVPALWTNAGPAQRGFVLFEAAALVLTAALWTGGHSKKAWGLVGGLALLVGLAVASVDFFHQLDATNGGSQMPNASDPQQRVPGAASARDQHT